MKTVRVLMIVCCLVVLAGVCRAEEDLEPTKGEVYRERGVTVVLPVDWEPFSFVDAAGNQVGYLVEVWDAWARTTGVETRIEYLDLAEGVERLKNGQVDILGGVRFSQELVEEMQYTGALQSSTSVLAIRDGGSVDCSNALAVGSVGLVNDSHVRQMAAAKYPDLNAVFYADEMSAVRAFSNGEVDGIVVGYPHLAAADAETGVLSGLNICRTLFYHEVYGAVLEHEAELLELVNDGVDAIPVEEMNRIEKQWFLTAEKPKPDWVASSLPAAVAVLFLLSAVIVWFKRRS